MNLYLLQVITDKLSSLLVMLKNLSQYSVVNGFLQFLPFFHSLSLMFSLCHIQVTFKGTRTELRTCKVIILVLF